jgi:hypothetical protein
MPGPTPVVFTTGGTGGAGRGNAPASKPEETTESIDPAAKTLMASFTSNNGLTFVPISQYDPAQYATGQLPGYEERAGVAAIFAMIGRATAPDKTVPLFINGFWSAVSGAGDPSLLKPKVTFSNGAGQDVTPEEDNGFPIVAGATNIVELLSKGPLLLQGAPPADGSPAPWLLAIKLTEDGKGIIANDPASGRQVIVAYDPATRTVGAVTSMFDPSSRTWTPIAEVTSVKLAGEASVPRSAISGLQGFAATNYLAVVIN